jgi:RHS repeat-associated protein
MIAKRYLPSTLNGSNRYYDTTALVGFTTEFDRASNKLFERHLHAENRSYLYNALDSMNRLREYQRGTLSMGGSTVASAITLPGTDSQRSYDLDGLGNWRRTEFLSVGGSDTTEVRQYNPLNQITRIDSTHLAYDDNGNLTDDGTLLLEYDPFNRLKRVKNASNSQTVGEYTYDAMGRRVRKVITNGGITGTLPNGTTDYLYDQNQCVEERDGSNSHAKQYVWGVYIDELIQQKTYATTGGGGLAAGAYYPLQDLHYRVMALTDDGGDVVEAYDYDPYGKRQVFSAGGTDAIWFTDDDTTTYDASCEYGHQGLLHDEETGLVYNRARMRHPTLGRFLQRDPIWYADGMNTYQYVGSNPINGLDPLGLANIPNEKCQKQCDQIAAEAKKRGVAPGVIATYLNNCYICCGTKEDNDTCAGSIPIAPKKPVGPRPKPRCYCAANDCAPNE